MKPGTRLKKFIQQFRKVLKRSVEQDINEADTRILVMRILQELGYHVYKTASEMTQLPQHLCWHHSEPRYS